MYRGVATSSHGEGGWRLFATYIEEALTNLVTAVIAGLIVYDLTHRDR